MKELLNNSENYFYTDIFLTAISIIGAFTGIIFSKKFKELKWVFIYPLSSALQQIIIYFLLYYYKININSVYSFEILSEKIFLLIEFISLSIVFYNSSIIIKLRNLIGAIAIIYLFISISLHLANSNFYLFNINLIYIHSLLILTMAIISLIDIFKSPPKLKLLDIPRFWVITGALLYFLCTLPIYIAHDFLFSKDNLITEFSLYSINYICYSILYFFIIRAFLCKQAEN